MQAATGEIMVGDWAFSPGSGSLARNGERRRLEHRAARVLELLCRRSGEPVSAAELVATVWNGRSLSQNSVAVVIADLRRALDDDSRQPRYIETIPKRGYRLLAPVVAEETAPVQPAAADPLTMPVSPQPRRFIMAVIALAAIVGVATLIFSVNQPPAPLVVAIAAIPNETGDRRYDPLALAVTDLVATEIGGLPGVQVMRAPGGRVDAQVGGRLVLWNQQASLSLRAEDPATGAVLWSAMAAGPAAALPRQIHAAAANFSAYVETRRAGRVDKVGSAP